MNELKKEFREDMAEIYRQSLKIGYRPTRFLEMISSGEDIVSVARKLISKETDGFTRLWELKHLELSVEHYVLEDKYRDLFTDEERKICQERLQKYGYYK